MHWLVLLVIVMLLFGPKRLPEVVSVRSDRWPATSLAVTHEWLNICVSPDHPQRLARQDSNLPNNLCAVDPDPSAANHVQVGRADGASLRVRSVSPGGRVAQPA